MSCTSGIIDGCNDWQKVTEGAKDREKRGVEIQSEMQDVQV